MQRITPTVRALIMLNALVFLAQLFIRERVTYACSESMVVSENVVTGTLALWSFGTQCFQPYQLFTYMFVHGGFMHIFFNMMALAFMGPILETFWGQKRFTLFYIITGVGAAIFNIAVEYFFGVGGFGIMVGASGAIYGILMAFGLIFPNLEVMLLIPPIPIKAKYLVFVLGAMNFMLDSSGTTAHFAHLGGMVFGFIMVRYWRSHGGNYY